MSKPDWPFPSFRQKLIHRRVLHKHKQISEFCKCSYCYVTGIKAELICRQSAPREIYKGKFLSLSGSSDELWELITGE